MRNYEVVRFTKQVYYANMRGIDKTRKYEVARFAKHVNYANIREIDKTRKFEVAGFLELYREFACFINFLIIGVICVFYNLPKKVQK